MAILTKTAITSILLGDSVDPTIANLPHSELETNVDNIITYLKNSSVGAFEYDSVTSTGLNFDYESGTYQNRNVSYIIASGSRSLTASVTSYIYINATSGVIGHNSTGFVSKNIPLWEVTTDGSSITDVIDRRTSFGVRNTLGIDDQATSTQITVDNTNTTFSNNVIFSSTSTISGIMTHNVRPAFNGGTSGSTSPFTVDSTFVVSNLNADLLDGQSGAYYATATHQHTAFDYNSTALAAGATVLSDLDVTNGIVTNLTTRELTPADIGAQVAGTYNTIIGTDSDIDTSGATIIDNIFVTDGVITSMGTRELTPADIGAATTSHNQSATTITTGTLDVARGGTGVTSSTGTGNTVRSASPALTENPTAPTQAAGNNSTRLATTAFALANAGANSIGQAELKTTTGEVSTTATIYTNLTLAGGTYGFYPQVKESGDGLGANVAILGTEVGATYITNIAIRANTTGTAYAQQRYITASKPYVLNPDDGEVGRFIFAVIDNGTGKVESVYQAEEAPWHYNGKTDIRGKLGKDGKKYRLRKDMSDIPFTLESALSDAVKMQEYVDAFYGAKITKELITQELCQRDMIDIPHPFLGNDLTDKTIVMLDPVCDLNHKLSEMCVAHDEFDLNKLLHEGYLKISNEGLERSGPEGILIPSFKWKNTL